MKPSEIESLIVEVFNQEIEGKTRDEINDMFNELAERNDGSLIDGIKLGYLYSVVNFGEEEP